MQKSLKQMILNKITGNPELSATATKIAGYKSSGFHKMLNRDGQPNDFNGYKQAVEYLFPNNAKELLIQDAANCKPTLKIARNMLVYLELNSENDEIDSLVDRMLYCNNTVSSEWAIVFKIDQDYKKGITDFQETLDLLCAAKTHEPELQIHTAFLKSYLYLDKQYYDAAFTLVQGLTKLIDTVEEDFLRNLYKSRLMLIQVEHYMRKGSVNRARSIAFDLYNCIDNNTFRAWAALHLGNSYSLESLEKSVNFFNLGLGLKDINSKSISNLKKSKTFTQNLWGVKPDSLVLGSNINSERHEEAHYYIRQNQHDKALEILNTGQNRTDNECGFNFYLKGLISGDIKDYCLSLKYFKRSHDYFFKQLPLMELKKLEINSCILEALAE